jgi:hypothetical protein
MFETMIASLSLFLFVAILTEAVTEVVKNLFPEGLIEDKMTYALSIIVGVVLSFTFELNPFGLSGSGEIVSIIIAGLIASRGANYVNGLMKKFNIIR